MRDNIIADIYRQAFADVLHERASSVLCPSCSQVLESAALMLSLMVSSVVGPSRCGVPRVRCKFPRSVQSRRGDIVVSPGCVARQGSLHCSHFSFQLLATVVLPPRINIPPGRKTCGKKKSDCSTRGVFIGTVKFQQHYSNSVLISRCPTPHSRRGILFWRVRAD